MKKILIVDDESSVRRLTARMIASLGYETLEAGSGEEALEICNGQGAEIGLILTDFNMPNMDGSELYDELSKLDTQWKVIFISGFDKDTLAEQMTDSPNICFVQKPFTRDVLRENIAAMMPVGEPAE